MTKDYPKPYLLIGGKPRTAGAEGKTAPVINPATGETLAEMPLASTSDLEDALEAAKRGFAKWRAVPPGERGKVLKTAAALLRERQEEIARIATLEEGKTIHEARIEVLMAANTLEWYGEECRRAYGRIIPADAPGKRYLVKKEPVGPVAAFAPWNFPVGNPARKLGAPIAAGCSVIMKPAEEAPSSALEVARALMDAGLPEDVMSIVFGVPSEVSEHLIASPVIRKVSFTGSTAVGKQLMKLAAEGCKRTTMELGGHGPVLVFVDVDLEKTLDMAVGAKYRNAGQVCVSPTRFLVQEPIYDKFVDGFKARVAKLKVGNGLDEANNMGPLAHPRRITAMETLFEDAARHQAKFVAGGERIGGPGLFWQPSILADIPLDARCMNDEPFGPVALINRFSNYEDVVKEANRLPYGLAAYAFTRDAGRVARLGDDIESGMIALNSFQIATAGSPFGGVKESGHGHEEGPEGLEACLVTKFVSETS
jgi:succinate-semialdehyde dehydrogenase/glutarate-semialdehyde dehydrogenase